MRDAIGKAKAQMSICITAGLSFSDVKLPSILFEATKGDSKRPCSQRNHGWYQQFEQRNKRQNYKG